MLLLSALKYWCLFLLSLIGKVDRVDLQASPLGSGGDFWNEIAKHHCSIIPLGFYPLQVFTTVFHFNENYAGQRMCEKIRKKNYVETNLHLFSSMSFLCGLIRNSGNEKKFTLAVLGRKIHTVVELLNWPEG